MGGDMDGLPAIHPGEFLKDELAALGLSARRLAANLQVPPNAVTAILNGQRGISATMAVRLATAFGTTARYWLNLQALYDLKRAQENPELAAELREIRPYAAA